jgi:hypothetical protein
LISISLGLFDGMGCPGSMLQLRPGDSLFPYTDAVPEAQNIHQDDLSDDRLMAILGANSKFSCKDLIHSVTREVSAFTGDAPQSDEVTMLLFGSLSSKLQSGTNHHGDAILDLSSRAKPRDLRCAFLPNKSPTSEIAGFA